MKSFFFKLFLFITLFVLSSTDLLAQVNWTKYPDNPVLTGPTGSWYRNLYMPCVLYNSDSSRFEMWFAAAQGGRPFSLGFSVSSDGVSWTVHPTKVLEPSPGMWDSYTVEQHFVRRENGQYKMWYSACSTWPNFKIGYATSLDGINWIKDTTHNPILEAGTDVWEAGGVEECYAIPTTDGYDIWYGGYTIGSTSMSLGRATSLDGIEWERDLVNNPVLKPGDPGEWDDSYVFYPQVLIKDEIYHMWYTALDIPSISGISKVGLATSSDGINWVKNQSNPILGPSSGQWDGLRIEGGSVLLVGDTLYMWYSGNNGSLWQIGLAKSLYTPLPLPPGTYTIGTGGNFATIQDAFDKLETDGVAGNVTLELIDELYVAPATQFGFRLNGPIPGAGPNSGVTIKPAENKNVTIEGNNEGVIYLINTSYVTLDGVNMTGPTTLTIHAQQNASYVYNDALDFINNSDHNIIQNVTFIVEDNTRASGFGFWYNQTGSFAPDSNLIQNNFVKKAGVAIFIVSPSSIIKAKGNIVKGNQIGSEIDSLVAYGIQIYQGENTIIENNIIQNLKVTISGADNLTAGIVSSVCSGTMIRNNVIHNLKGISGFTSSGIVLYGVAGSLGNDNYVYNNMIYDIHSTSNQSNSRVAGIQMQHQSNPKIYYNSVYLSGTGANQLGSAAFYIYTGCTNVDAKNNIFINTRDESPYFASAIYDYSASNLTSDYNDLYYDATNTNNCLVRAGGNDYKTLGEWQVTTQDLHSYIEMPPFISSTDLHIDETIATYLESRGTPIAGIETDLDGDTRNVSTPDIGADEFDGIVGVENEITLPTEFALEQNYPNPFNPRTTFRYSIPQTSKVVIKIYDILGNEIATLMDEEKSVGTYELTWNAASLSSGIYFYQLKAGDYMSTKKMILLK